MGRRHRHREPDQNIPAQGSLYLEEPPHLSARIKVPICFLLGKEKRGEAGIQMEDSRAARLRARDGRFSHAGEG
jgi:hypothetical protein